MLPGQPSKVETNDADEEERRCWRWPPQTIRRNRTRVHWRRSPASGPLFTKRRTQVLFIWFSRNNNSVSLKWVERQFKRESVLQTEEQEELLRISETWTPDRLRQFKRGKEEWERNEDNYGEEWAFISLESPPEEEETPESTFSGRCLSLGLTLLYECCFVL